MRLPDDSARFAETRAKVEARSRSKQIFTGHLNPRPKNILHRDHRNSIIKFRSANFGLCVLLTVVCSDGWEKTPLLRGYRGLLVVAADEATEEEGSVSSTVGN